MLDPAQGPLAVGGGLEPPRSG